MNANNQRIITTLYNNPVVIDDHNGKERPVTKVGIWTTAGGVEHVAFMFDEHQTSAFCINPLVMGAEEKVHISTWSVGPAITFKGRSLEESLEAWNADVEANPYPWPSGRFGEVFTVQ